MELTSPFQQTPFEPPCSGGGCASRSASPTRVVGFCSPAGSLASSNSRSPSSVLDFEPDLRPSMCRKGSLGKQLREQTQQPQAGCRLSIRTRFQGGRGMGSKGLQHRLGRARSTASQLQPPVEADAAAVPALAASELCPGDATVPSACPLLTRQQSSTMEIPTRLRKARTCPLELDDDIIAAAVEAYSSLQHSHAPTSPPNQPPTSLFGCRSDSGGGPSPAAAAAAPAQRGRLGTAAVSVGGGGSGTAWLQRAGSCSLTTQEQLFAAHAAATQSQAQVVCLHEALNKERETVGTLRAQLQSMTLERDELRSAASASTAATTAKVRTLAAVGPQGGLERQVGVEDFTSPFGGFSPFTPALREEGC